MKIENIDDVDSFFKVVNECKGPVELISPEGDRINLKSRLTQYLSMATIFSNGYIRELDLVAHDKDDTERLIKYMYR
ncbi:MAG: polya polymerase [Oscillospiraceae bacterium]|nr:polya polymerase [Oscillospiraceae bacterium]